jgi:hypothetical protein
VALFVPHSRLPGELTANAYRRAVPPREHGNTTMGTLSQADEAKLKAQLQDAVVACTERCLYHSAKWCVDMLSPSDVC